MCVCEWRKNLLELGLLPAKTLHWLPIAPYTRLSFSLVYKALHESTLLSLYSLVSPPTSLIPSLQNVSCNVCMPTRVGL